MKPLNMAASQTLKQQRTTLARAIISRLYDLHPQDWSGTQESRTTSLRDTLYHLDYLSEAVADDAPALFNTYAAWVKSVLTSRHLPVDIMEHTLACMRVTMQAELLADEACLVDEYIAQCMQYLPTAPLTPPLFVHDSLPLGGLAKEYLDTLLGGDRRAASELILAAVARGVNIQDIYLHVFQRTQYEIGRLWQINQITVAQEHFCTAATQLIMSQLYPHIFNTNRIGRRLVATCIGGELHEIGARMVADFFEMAGWDTYYLGANTPAESIIRTLAERRAHVLGISATMTYHVSQVSELIAQVRASDAGQHVKIIVGGYPFKTSDGLWRAVEADGYAPDARQAVSLATDLVTA